MVGLVVSAIGYLRVHRFSTPTRVGGGARRQQVIVFERKPPRPSLRNIDRLFWVALRCIWSGWAGALVIVKPRRLSAGTAPDFGYFGVCAPGHTVGRHSTKRSARLSAE